MSKGKLFYVVGPSGAGKDTLISYAKKKTEGKKTIFVRRYITRPADAGGEDHISIKPEDFKKKLSQSFFALWWESHSNFYGISGEIDDWIEAGYHTVVNGSRGYLQKALAIYPDMITILVEVSETVLKERLRNRGRETDSEIEQRIIRSRMFDNFAAPNLIRLKNDHALTISGDRFVDIITNYPSHNRATVLHE